MASEFKSNNSDLSLNGINGDIIMKKDDIEVGRVGPGGLGKILQVRYFMTSTAVEVASDQLTTIGLTASITPSSPNSKILIMADVQSYMNIVGSGYGIGIVRNGSIVFESSNPYSVYNQTDGTTYQMSPFKYLDTPNTTDEITYDIKVKTYLSRLVRFQRAGCQSFLTMFEVGA